MSESLEQLFQESVEQVHTRERTALDDLLDRAQHQVVLFGAGTLGRRAVPLLQQIGTTVLAFTDNNPKNWGTRIEGIPVISPESAASTFGQSALFLVTIWNVLHWYRETYDQLRSLGCTLISSYAPLYWRFPDTFLQVLLLNEPPHRVYIERDAVLSVERLWSDSKSHQTYCANIRWRALGDGSDLPGRDEVNTYFPGDIFSIAGDGTLLDCGAYDGDTIRMALQIHPTGFRAIHAVEADAISFDRLQAFVATLDTRDRSRVTLYRCAVGFERGSVRFASDGTVGAKISDHGTLVELFPIDELFAEKPLTFIKMDIEGAEYDALRGATKVIQRDQPILAICVYHTQNDIWRIPLLVRDMLPDHKLYLRGYEGDGFQTVLYAVPPDRSRNKNEGARLPRIS